MKLMSEHDDETTKKEILNEYIKDLQKRYDKYVSLKVFTATEKYIQNIFGTNFLRTQCGMGFKDGIQALKEMLEFKDKIYEMILDKIIDVRNEIEHHTMNLSDKKIADKFNTIVQQTEPLLNQIDEEYDNSRFGGKTYQIDPDGKEIRVSDIDICISALMYG